MQQGLLINHRTLSIIYAGSYGWWHWLPKAKPSLQGGVLVHRIEAGEWERQNILKPVADIANTAKIVQVGALTVVCVGIGMAGYSAYWFMKKTAGWASDAKDVLDVATGGGGLASFLQKEKGMSEADAKKLRQSGIGQPLDNVPIVGPLLRLLG